MLILYSDLMLNLVSQSFASRPMVVSPFETPTFIEPVGSHADTNSTALRRAIAGTRLVNTEVDISFLHFLAAPNFVLMMVERCQ